MSTVDRILLGQLGSNGDCLYATILARQLRQDYPKAHITWAISNQARNVITNNPHVDAVWEVPVPGWDYHEMMWRVFEREAQRLHGQRAFDHILLSQIWPNNFQNYDGTVRSSILRAYGRPISVPIANVIALTDDEISRAQDFVARSGIANFRHRILFECSSKSGQSFVTPDNAQDIADALYRILPDCTVIFSTHLPMTLRDPRSRHAGAISLREVTELTHHCTLFVGAGSGGTVAASASSAKILPMVQLLSANTSVFASFAHDFEHFGLTDRDVLELTNEDPAVIAECLKTVCSEGINAARAHFNGCIPVIFDHFKWLLEQCLLDHHRYLDAARATLITAERYGFAPSLVSFARERIIPNLPHDPSWYFAQNRRIGERLRAEVEAAGDGAMLPTQRLFSEGSAYLRTEF
jgi:hypothetical protein